MGRVPSHDADKLRLVRIWQGLLACLDTWDLAWRSRAGMDLPLAVASADPLQPIENAAAFKAFSTALVSGNARWDRIEPILGQLSAPFCEYDPARFAQLTDQEIDGVTAWIQQHGAASAGLAARLQNLRNTASLFSGGGEFDSADALIRSALHAGGGSLDDLAALLGTSKRWKLPGFGIALAAEGLRLLGFDLCKPDRHVLRAAGAWHLVTFARWERKGPFTPPSPRPAEVLSAMRAVRGLAEANGLATTRVSTAIWTAGAASGARLTNKQLEEIGA